MSIKPIALFLILSLCLAQQTKAQNQAIDSLKAELKAYQFPAVLQAKDTAYLLTATYLCGKYFRLFELDSMAETATHALALFDRYFKDIKEPPYVVKRLELYKMQFFRIQGMANHENGNYAEALLNFQQEMKQAEKFGSVQDIASCYTNIALCHREMEDYKLAFQYAQKSVALLKNTPFQSTLANNYTIYSSYYNQVKSDLDSAIVFAKLSREIYRKAGRDMNEASASFDIADFFAEKYAPDSVLFYLNQMKDFAFSQPNPDLQIRYYTKAGEALFAKGQTRLALDYLSKAAQIAEELESPTFRFHVNKYYSLALAANGQQMAALKSINVAFDAYTEDLSTENTRMLTTNQLNYEFEKKEALAKLELQRQQRLRDISLIGLGLGLLVALLLFRLYRQSKKTARLLAEKNTQIEKSYRELKETQEQLVLTEKQREAQSIRVGIARDIHDELGAGLTKITMMSDFVRKKLHPEQEDVANMLQRITENSKGVSAALSEIVWAVNPVHDTLESLSNYLKNYAVHYLDGTGLQGEFDVPTDIAPRNVDPAMKRNIFLVLKESLNNTVKYAGASKVRVAFETDGQTFKLCIHDNGVGFNPEAVQPGDSSGNGLVNLKARMESLGCRYHIQSAPGQGCTVEAAGTLV